MLEAAEAGNRLGKDEFKAVVPGLRVGLLNAQFDLRSADFPVFVFVAGDDRIAAGEVVKRLHEWMDARYIDTTVFGDMRPEEAERPRQWRMWRAMPPRGRMAIWAGGLMRMIEAYVAGLVDDAALEAWTVHLETLQAELLADGALVVKLFLHTPADEQRARLKAAEDGRGGWRVDERDWAMLETNSEARPPAERFLRRTSAPGAPWTVIEATDTRYRDVAAARTILDALTARLAAPPPEGPSAPVEMFSPRPDQAHRARGRRPVAAAVARRLPQAAREGTASPPRPGARGPRRARAGDPGVRGLGRGRQGRRDPPLRRAARGGRLPRHPRRRAHHRGVALPLPVALLARPARPRGSS